MKKFILGSMAAAALAMPVLAQQATPSTDMTDAEVRKVDVGNKKITLKHGEIKNLDMPPMTMVFQLKDPAMLDKVQAGDKVRFKAEQIGGSLVVTEIDAAK
ncbi:copper-binding protein [Piscinibacter sp.]|uniref:copper-binding protein n=1 Tax=Piscinibacter sp. TaxID=1903157 RepID=UPI002CCB698C|nr:copper-binding protein [Albitalea sp.]HUG24484.1 copper-binding protein [Albitalea sp.]